MGKTGNQIKELQKRIETLEQRFDRFDKVRKKQEHAIETLTKYLIETMTTTQSEITRLESIFTEIMTNLKGSD